jgi:hypothetical protein
MTDRQEPHKDRACELRGASGTRPVMHDRQPFRNRLAQSLQHHRFRDVGVPGQGTQVGPGGERRVQGRLRRNVKSHMHRCCRYTSYGGAG